MLMFYLLRDLVPLHVETGIYNYGKFVDLYSVLSKFRILFGPYNILKYSLFSCPSF